MPELILIAVFVIALFIFKRRRNRYEFVLAGSIAMSAMLVVTSIAHFVFSNGMSMMIPEFIPFKVELVYLTGIFEMLAAVGLCIPRYRAITARWLIVFFVLLLPANIYEAANHVNLETATHDGHGLNYLWFRIPMQILFIGWTYFFSIKKWSAYESRHCQFGLMVKHSI